MIYGASTETTYVESVSGAAAQALICFAAVMMRNIKKLDCDDFIEILPAFFISFSILSLFLDFLFLTLSFD